MNKALKCTECGHLAVLYTYPHQYAGIWECQNEACGASDTHGHDDIQIVDVEQDTMRNGEHDTYTTQIYECQTCGIQTDGDPAEDRADAIADLQIMQALGK